MQIGIHIHSNAGKKVREAIEVCIWHPGKFKE